MQYFVNISATITNGKRDKRGWSLETADRLPPIVSTVNKGYVSILISAAKCDVIKYNWHFLQEKNLTIELLIQRELDFEFKLHTLVHKLDN